MKNFGLLLGFLVIMSGCAKEDVGTNGEVPSFSLAWSEYPSWSVFGVAHELGILDGDEGEMSELEEKYGVDVVLKEADYDTCIQYYGTGIVDASCLTNMDVLAPSIGRPARAVLPTSTSDGADAVISVEATDVEGLKGVKVYGLDKSVSEYLFVRGLEINGADLSEFEFVGQDPSAASQSLQTGSPNVKTICVWNPFKMSCLEKVENAKVVFDSSLIPGEIVDMVVVGEDSMSRPKAAEFCQCLSEAFYRVCDMLEDESTRDDTLVALGAKFSDLNAEQMAVCLQETKLYSTPESGKALYDGTNADGAKLEETMVRVVDFCVDKGICDQKPVVSFNKTQNESNLTFDSSFMK